MEQNKNIKETKIGQTVTIGRIKGNINFTPLPIRFLSVPMALSITFFLALQCQLNIL